MSLVAEWWAAIWPNLAASGITFSAGMLWAKRRLLGELERREVAHVKRHRELRSMINDLLGKERG